MPLRLRGMSGIGPANLLRDLGIEVVRDIAGVGENLQDHFNSYLSYRVNQPITLNYIGNSTTRQILAGIRYVFTRTGPLTGTGIYAGAFVRSDKRLENPDLQINMSMWSTESRSGNKLRESDFVHRLKAPVVRRSPRPWAGRHTLSAGSWPVPPRRAS